MNEGEESQHNEADASIDEVTPFDNPPSQPVASNEETGRPAPDPALWESIAPPDAPPDQPAAGQLSENVKIAAGLLIVHGACLGLNGFLWRDADHGNQLDSANLLRGLLWFGCMFLVASGLFERRIWAWWSATLIGGSVGIVNTLSVIGALLSQSLVKGDDRITIGFVVPVIAVAAIAMLVSTALLLTPAAKANFGITKDNPTGLF